MKNNNSKPSSGGGLLSSLMGRLGSMNLAVLLLLTLCLIMLAGTLTEQKQSMAYYQELYGPFWSQVFEFVQLFNIYNSPWFLLIVLLLLSSIFACVWRNAPRILEAYGTSAKEYHPGKSANSRHWDINNYQSVKIEQLQAQLIKRKYSVTQTTEGNDVHLYARKGSLQKLGYLFIHLAILTIIIGGLVDGRAFSVFSQQESQALEQNDSINRISRDAFSVVQNLEIAKPVNELKVLEDGVEKTQALPFRLQIDDSSESYYANGQVRDYSATISISSEEGMSIVNGQIFADKSFQYEDYTFALRGSSGTHGTVNLSLYQFGKGKPMLDNEHLTLPYQFSNADAGRFVVDGFRGHNADPGKEINLSDEFQDIGPSMSYQLLNKHGVPVRFDYYLEIVNRNDNAYHLLRASMPKTEPVLIFIPAHGENGLTHFLSFNDVLYSKKLITLLVNAKIKSLFSKVELKSGFLEKELASQISSIVEQYAEGGREAVINSQVEGFKESDRETATLFVEKMLDSTLVMLYQQVVLADKSGNVESTQQDALYMKDLLFAVEQMKILGVNSFPIVHNYERQQSVMLNIAKQPGKYAVIFGLFILLFGVLVTFYVNNREYSIRIVPDQTTARVYMDGYTNRQDILFNYEFNNLSDVLMSVSV